MKNVNNDIVNSVLTQRRNRRDAMKKVLTATLGAAALPHFSRESFAQQFAAAGGTDAAVLNFALNLEYLEAEFYSYATTGASIEAQGVQVNGAGTAGTVTIKANPRVTFTNPLVQGFAEELTMDEVAHVKFLRTALTAAGVQPVARPAINLQESFSAAAQAAGIVPAGQPFDPFMDESSFLLAAFIFEDVGVTAYKGGSRLLTNKDFLESAAGILAAEAYHAGVIRTLVYQAGQTAQDIAQKISDLRDAVDGADDRDQGVMMNGKVNLVPTDANGVAFSRDTRQVLNIVYLAPNAASGGFFPAGLNGAIR